MSAMVNPNRPSKNPFFNTYPFVKRQVQDASVSIKFFRFLFISLDANEAYSLVLIINSSKFL
jgi:hypothetical protein